MMNTLCDHCHNHHNYHCSHLWWFTLCMLCTASNGHSKYANL